MYNYNTMYRGKVKKNQRLKRKRAPMRHEAAIATSAAEARGTARRARPRSPSCHTPSHLTRYHTSTSTRASTALSSPHYSTHTYHTRTLTQRPHHDEKRPMAYGKFCSSACAPSC